MFFLSLTKEIKTETVNVSSCSIQGSGTRGVSRRYSWMTIAENEKFSGIKGDNERKREEKEG